MELDVELAVNHEPQANKSFSVQQFFKNAAEVWASSPHLRSKLYFAICFPLLQLHFLKLINSQVDCLCETSCKFGQGNGAIAACWQAKAGVEPPFAGCGRPFSLKAVFHVKHGSWETTRIRFGKAGAHPQLAWESQLPLKPCISLRPLDFKSNCDSSD